jgi:hypothetical protein
VGQPRREAAEAGGLLEERPDPARDGVDAVPVGEEAQQRLGRDLGDAVVGVRAGEGVLGELAVRAGRAADGVVGGGVDDAGHVVGHHRVEQCRRGGDVRGELRWEGELLGDPGQVHDGVQPLRGEDRLDGVGVGAVDLVPREGGAVGWGDQVEPDHLVAEALQADRDHPAEAAGGTRHQDAHRRVLRSSRRPG